MSKYFTLMFFFLTFCIYSQNLDSIIKADTIYVLLKKHIDLSHYEINNNKFYTLTIYKNKLNTSVSFEDINSNIRIRKKN
jgi:hypothetical protein